MKNILNIVLMFCWIFGFSLNKGEQPDSTIIVGISLVFYIFLQKGYAAIVMAFLRKKYFFYTVVLYLLINLWSLLVNIINQTFDFSFNKTFLHVFIEFIIGMLLYNFYIYKKAESKIVDYLVIVYAIQTAIEWMAFLIPSVKEIVNLTKSEGTILLGLRYSGIRAVSLAGSDFFGLAAGFGVVLIIYWSKRNTILDNNNVLKNLLYLFLVSGTFFAGRTGYIGLGIGLFYKLLFGNKSVKRIKFTEFITSGIFLFFIIIIWESITEFISSNESVTNLLNFTFEVLINLLNGKGFSAGTLNSLAEMYDVKIGVSTIIFGDGQYTDSSGFYYMNTDVGYLRIILYMGVLGLILMLLMQLMILKLNNGYEKNIKIILMLYLLIIQFKGEAISYALIVFNTILMFSYQDLFNKNIGTLAICSKDKK